MVNSESKVAYVIVCWNNSELLKECIESIKTQDFNNSEIILVDNASKDDSINLVKSQFPEVTVLAQQKNMGFAKGNNIGVRKALEDINVKYIVLLNTDARLEKNWTSTLLNAIQTKPHAALVQSITLDYYNHHIIDSTHVYIAENGQGTQGSWRRSISRGYDVGGIKKVFGCNAAALLITRNFIEAQPFNDLFDETMFMYLEDVDLSARATIMGWDNFVVSGTRAFHMGSVSSAKKDPSYSLYMTFRNNTGLLVKNLPIKTLWHTLLQVPKADRAAILHLKRIGKKDAVSAVIKGRLISILFIPLFVLKRYKLKSSRGLDEKYLRALMKRGF